MGSGSIPQYRAGQIRDYVRETASSFGEKCLYFERAGEAEFVCDPAYDPLLGQGDNFKP